MKVSFESLTHEKWAFVIEPSQAGIGDVWLHIFAGPASAALFLTVDQARSIGAALTGAADQVAAATSAPEKAAA